MSNHLTTHTAPLLRQLQLGWAEERKKFNWNNQWAPITNAWQDRHIEVCLAKPYKHIMDYWSENGSTPSILSYDEMLFAAVWTVSRAAITLALLDMQQREDDSCAE
ncbi:hypothetical protein TNCV_2930971 [Trichonephila clavipes]|nr:hypothetical protein TNCV_2930971 [Trichonephila clavipes]